MRIKENLVLLVVMTFLCFCAPASLNPFEDFLHLDHLQGNTKHKAIAHPEKFGHASGGRGASHRGTGSGDHPDGGGGSSAIPLYAAAAGAGAANLHNRNHHKNSGSNCKYSFVGQLSFALAIFICLLPWEEMQV